MNGTNEQVRAGCYCRISSDPNDKREGVERQREDTTALCEVKGWTPTGYYIDNDRSASSGKERPEWDRLLADLKAGRIDAIAAWDQDRGWRMMHELEDLRRFFESLDRKVYLATTGQGDIDLYSPTGVLTVHIKTAVSEHEIAMMKVRQRRAGRQRAEQGKPKWRKAFGYMDAGCSEDCPPKCKGPHIGIDTDTAPLVADAYSSILSAKTATLQSVADLFNSAGRYGVNGKPWTPSTVSLFLRSPRNAGLRTYGGKTAQYIIGNGNWPALVDETTWYAAQAVLDAPTRSKPGRKSVRQHRLTGVMRCGKAGCDGYLSGKWAMQRTGGAPGRPKAGETKTHHGQLKHSITYGCKTCRGCSVRAEHVEPLLTKVLGTRLAQPDAVDLLKADQFDAAEAERVRAERARLLTQLDAIADAVGDGWTLDQAKRATRGVQAKLNVLPTPEVDAERAALLADIPLGTPEAVAAVERLTPDRFRRVLDLLAVVTVRPVGKGGRVFDPTRVQVDWR